jgi:hypothetical protein
MQISPKIETIYIDFMRLAPTLTHFADRKMLKTQFGFFIDPVLYGSEYLSQLKAQYPSRFIHQFGALKPLPPWKCNYSFWRNLFGSPSLDNYVQSYQGAYFGYLPYFIKSSSKVSIEPNPQTDTAIAQILKRAKIALSARLFPIGASSMHLMVFFPSEHSEVQQFMEIQKMILNKPLFRMTKGQSANSQALTLLQIFDEIQKEIYYSLYNQPSTVDVDSEATSRGIHRIIYLHLSDSNQLPSADVEATAASLITLMSNQVLKNRVKYNKLLNPRDLIIFHPKATLFFTPNLDPHKEGFCLWNNYINVVELATAQNVVLGRTNFLLKKALASQPIFIEFADNATLLQALGRAHLALRGGHRFLHKEIDSTLRISETIQQFVLLLESYKALQPFNIVGWQLQRIEATLKKIKDAASRFSEFQFNPIYLVIIDYSVDETTNSINSINDLTKNLREIGERKRQGNPFPNDLSLERTSNLELSREISTHYTEMLLRYEQIIWELLETLEKKGINVLGTKTKLNANQFGNLSGTSVDALVKAAKPYVENLFEVAEELLNRIP